MFYQKKKEGGYTLVEFIIIVMIFGTISLFVLPFFDKNIYRFKQKEASGITNSMIKAAQSNYALFGNLPENMGAVLKFSKLKKCTANNVETEGSLVCIGFNPVAVENNDISFYSPSGNYKVDMRRVYTLDKKVIYQVKANPNGSKYLNNGSAVVGCFNSFSGSIVIKEYSAKSSDRGIKPYINCSANSELITEEERERLEQERLEQERLERERERLKPKPDPVKKCLLRNPRRPSQCLLFDK